MSVVNKVRIYDLAKELKQDTKRIMEELRREVAPVFRTREGKKTDVVVLGCTHYPLLTEEIAAVAPWSVSYIDPAPAIARRVADIVEETPLMDRNDNVPDRGTVILTSARGSASESLTAYAAMGFGKHLLLDVPA